MARFWDEQTLIVRAADFDESECRRQSRESIASWVMRLAEGKLLAALDDEPQPTPLAACAADTVVVCQGRILGKPKDPDEAREHLRLLSGTSHRVISGLAVRAADRGIVADRRSAVVSRVTFAPLSEDWIRWYLASGEPLDKAGSYAIQGLGGSQVISISGCYYNVMGLPVFELFHMLRDALDAFPKESVLHQILPWNRQSLR